MLKKGSMQGEHVRGACKGSMQGEHATGACNRSMQGEHSRGECNWSMQGEHARGACNRSMQGEHATGVPSPVGVPLAETPKATVWQHEHATGACNRSMQGEQATRACNGSNHVPLAVDLWCNCPLSSEKSFSLVVFFARQQMSHFVTVALHEFEKLVRMFGCLVVLDFGGALETW